MSVLCGSRVPARNTWSVGVLAVYGPFVPVNCGQHIESLAFFWDIPCECWGVVRKLENDIRGYRKIWKGAKRPRTGSDGLFLSPLGNTSMPMKADGMLEKCVVSNCLDNLSHMLSCWLNLVVENTYQEISLLSAPNTTSLFPPLGPNINPLCFPVRWQ